MVQAAGVLMGSKLHIPKLPLISGILVHRFWDSLEAIATKPLTRASPHHRKGAKGVVQAAGVLMASKLHIPKLRLISGILVHRFWDSLEAIATQPLTRASQHHTIGRGRRAWCRRQGS